MDSPVVNLVVVGYNHGKYFRENLDSIKNQTYKNINLIIADDASTDDSVSIVENWLLENRITAIKMFNIKNQGLAKTLNNTFPFLTGKYTKFIAADDYLHPDSIAKCVEKLEALNEQFGMVFTDLYMVNNISEKKNDIFDYNKIKDFSPLDFANYLLQINFIPALSVLMRTDVLIETGKYDHSILIEDYDRWLRISEKYKIAFVPEKLAYYRKHDSNISKIKSEIIQNDNLILRMKYDKSGICELDINDAILNKYVKKSLKQELINNYLVYKYRDRKISFCIKNKVPFFGYRILRKLF